MSEHDNTVNDSQSNSPKSSDRTTAQPTPEKSPGENSAVSESSDRTHKPYDISSQTELDITTVLDYLNQRYREGAFSPAVSIAVLRLLQHSGLMIDAEAEIEQTRRDVIRKIQTQHAESIDDLATLIKTLYLDFHHISRLADYLCTKSQELGYPNLAEIAEAIEQQAIESIDEIEAHDQTDHYPNSLIKSHDRLPAHTN